MNLRLKVAFAFLILLLGAYAKKNTSNAELANGFVQVKQVDGVWWFISPQGEKFVSIGVNHIEPHLWLAPYNQEATLKKYGEDMLAADGHFDTNSKAAQKWIDHQVDVCEDLHFNTFAKHTHPSINTALYKDQIYYVASFKTAPLALWRHDAGEGPMPDVFSDEFEDFVNQRVAKVVSEHVNEPNLLGYMYTDIPYWIMPKYKQRKNNEHVMIYPWFNTILRLGDATAGKQRWIQYLQDHYATPQAAAEVWGIKVDKLYGISWDKLALMQTWFKPANVEKATEDMLSFMEIIANRWYAMHYDAVKKRDTNHLLLGDKSMVEMYDDFLLPALRDYVDVVVIQSYNRWADDVKRTDKIYQKTGKPIFNGDGSHAFVHPKQEKYKVKGWWSGAKSMDDVINLYTETMDGMMATPYVIGWHHCGILQQWDGAARGDVNSNENGFMDPFENYYTEWTDVIREVNYLTKEMHEQAK